MTERSLNPESSRYRTYACTHGGFPCAGGCDLMLDYPRSICDDCQAEIDAIEEAAANDGVIGVGV